MALHYLARTVAIGSGDLKGRLRGTGVKKRPSPIPSFKDQHQQLNQASTTLRAVKIMLELFIQVPQSWALKRPFQPKHAWPPIYRFEIHSATAKSSRNDENSMIPTWGGGSHHECMGLWPNITDPIPAYSQSTWWMNPPDEWIRNLWLQGHDDEIMMGFVPQKRSASQVDHHELDSLSICKDDYSTLYSML